MVIDSVFGLNSTATQRQSASQNFLSRAVTAVSLTVKRLWCGMHGHLILMHFEPNRLSLECGLCGYHTEGWEVGRPLAARRQAENRVHSHKVRTERRAALRVVPSQARMAS